MAVKQILVGKAGSSATPLTLIKGDSNTQIIEMIVERYYGGVDLAGLAWSVTVENANSASDEYRGIEAIANGTNIAVRWKVTGTATAVVGLTKFKLSGYAQDGSDVLIWQSGTYHIRVEDTFSHTPGSETTAELTEVQKLIIYVDGELNKVIKAGTDAAEAAKAANKAADRANSVADGKNEGRITALEQFTTKPGEPYAVEGKLVQLDNFEGMPMNAVTRIEPAQAGSGDPSPSNIRPISGHTGAKLTRCGKNLAKSIYASGDTAAYMNCLYVDADIMPNTTYTISFVANAVNANILLYLNESLVSYQDFRITGARQSVTFTTKESMSSKPVAGKGHIMFKNGTALAAPMTFADVQFELGSAATEYTPYHGETFPASFGQTVYGGTLDWNKGVLTVDRAAESLTSAKINSVTDAGTSTQMFVIGINNASFDGHTINDAPVSSHYKGVKWYANPWNVNNSISYYSQYNLRVRDSRFGSISDYDAYIDAQSAAGTSVQICYKLKTPTTIQLTPAQLTALQGMNNIFCDAGETTVSGRKDILWLTGGLIDQIDTLKKAIISLGGNV